MIKEYNIYLSYTSCIWFLDCSSSCPAHSRQDNTFWGSLIFSTGVLWCSLCLQRYIFCQNCFILPTGGQKKAFKQTQNNRRRWAIGLERNDTPELHREAVVLWKLTQDELNDIHFELFKYEFDILPKLGPFQHQESSLFEWIPLLTSSSAMSSAARIWQHLSECSVEVVIGM